MYFVTRTIRGQVHVVEIDNVEAEIYTADIPDIPGTKAIGSSKDDAADRAAWLAERATA